MTKKTVISLVKPLLTEVLITVFMLLFLAFLMLKQEWGNDILEKGIFAVYAFACLAGGCQAGKNASKRKFLRGMEYGGIYFIVLCLLSLAAGKGPRADMIQVWQVMAVCIAGGMIGGMGSLLFDR